MASVFQRFRELFEGKGEPIVFSKSDSRPSPTPVTQIKQARGVVSPLADGKPKKSPFSFFNNFNKGSRPIVFAKDKPQPTATPFPSPTPQPQGQVLGARTKRAAPSSIPGFGTTNRTPQSDTFLEQTVLPITRQAGIPDAVAAGQFAAEGRLGGLGAGRNNFFNIAAFDSNLDAARRYDSPEAGVEAYAELIKRRYNEALNSQDPKEVLAAITALGYAGDPQTYQQRSPNDFRSYTEFVMNTPEFRNFFE